MRFIKDVQAVRKRAREQVEEGAVTPALELDASKSAAILNEALATELVCILRYQHHYYMAAGIHSAAARTEFKEHWGDEQRHAEMLCERIRQLGGKPDFSPEGLRKSHTEYNEGQSLAEMILEDLVAERIVIMTYSEMIRHFGEKDPTTRVTLETILADEEEHADDLADLLYSVDPSSGRPTERLTASEAIEPITHNGETAPARR
ncbi:MAG: bacterioferritin [bacterium]|nr:bacterioferritin [bacterium]